MVAAGHQYVFGVQITMSSEPPGAHVVGTRFYINQATSITADTEGAFQHVLYRAVWKWLTFWSFLKPMIEKSF